MLLRHSLAALLGGLSLTALVGIASAQDSDSGSASNAVDPVATVNGEAISLAIFEAYAAQRSAQMGDPQNPEVQSRLMDELIIQQLLVSKAQQQQLLDQDPQLHLQYRNLLATAAIRQLMEDIQPDEQAIQAEYEAQLAGLDTREFEASHILLDNPELAQEIIDKLDQGSDFAELARTHSIDSNSNQGGYLDWFSADVMVPDFSRAVATLEKGTYTKEPVQTEFGWHVIQLMDVREAPPPELEALRPRIVQQLQGQMINDYLMEQRQQASIEIKQP